MEYAVIVWKGKAEFLGQDPGEVYGWYENMVTALNTATDLVRNKIFFHAVAVKIL